MSRNLTAAGLAGAAIFAGAAVLTAEEPAPVPAAGLRAQGATLPPLSRETPRSPASANEASDIELAKLRLREGTQLSDVSGRFRQNGDSLLFLDAENREISGLPNLNLERIIRTLKSVEEPESVVWSVSGVVTEFSGRNYLLISRAVYKAASPPPAPENLAAEPPSGE